MFFILCDSTFPQPILINVDLNERYIVGLFSNFVKKIQQSPQETL